MRRTPAFLPEVGAVIFDEAHELEDVAGSYFGVSVSNGRVEELCRDVETSLQRNHLAFGVTRRSS